jgi:hypothetical protein
MTFAIASFEKYFFSAGVSACDVFSAEEAACDAVSGEPVCSGGGGPEHNGAPGHSDNVWICIPPGGE